MSGHSRWKQIKHKKQALDQRRSRAFSKAIGAITRAARDKPDPELNPDLKRAVEQARETHVPQEAIERAVSRAQGIMGTEELLIEAYGPGGIALLIQSITDSHNRTIQEIRSLLKERGGRWAEPGSVLWAFEEKGKGWEARYPQEVDGKGQEGLQALIDALKKHSDVIAVYSNLSS